ncbi:hypothetical protein FB107DRAFT_280729 [Schizophyllum commune]
MPTLSRSLAGWILNAVDLLDAVSAAAKPLKARVNSPGEGCDEGRDPSLVGDVEDAGDVECEKEGDGVSSVAGELA